MRMQVCILSERKICLNMEWNEYYRVACSTAWHIDVCLVCVCV